MYRTSQDLFQLAESMDMTDKMRSIALGQGQGVIAAAMIEKVRCASMKERGVRLYITSLFVFQDDGVLDTNVEVTALKGSV